MRNEPDVQRDRLDNDDCQVVGEIPTTIAAVKVDGK
jgi:hypothetical protein